MKGNVMLEFTHIRNIRAFPMSIRVKSSHRPLPLCDTYTIGVTMNSIDNKKEAIRRGYGCNQQNREHMTFEKKMDQYRSTSNTQELKH
jgi:hypothetical protein